MSTSEWHNEMRSIVDTVDAFNPDVAEFWFLRHGETALNKSQIVQTQHGVTLNDTGREQSRKAALLLADEPFDVIHASDLERTWETATIVNDVCKKPIHKAPGLWERNWGDYAGQSNVDLNWSDNPNNGESLSEFTLRTLQGFRDVLVKDKILIVAHGGNYAVLLAAFGLTFGRNLVVKNAQPIKATRDASAPRGWAVTPLS
ncbi:MAG: broad specificity phosphatase PhoE [Alphaproteobacteria bacterium]|jgi:broad specificity phosphatase PhoE